ncbi:MAG: sigma-70 family RNA polymerase sigma factor [Planctomycetota bacterium]
MDPRSDEALLSEHLAGKPGAFDELVARYAEDLYNFFLRFVGNGAAADDLVQETFLQVHLAGSTFDPGRTFKPWLYTIAANKGRDFMRSRSRRPAQSLDTAADTEGPTPAALLATDEPGADVEFESEERRQFVRDVITRMSEPHRLILMLGYYQKLPYAEIAEILGIPVGTVKSRLHAAVNQFARLWSAATDTPAPRRGPSG